MTVTKEQIDNLQERLSHFIRALNTKFSQDVPHRSYQIEPGGRKYIKISRVHGFEDATMLTTKSVYCFIDIDGNIYKAASWSAPAKHARGNIFNEGFDLQNCNEYSPMYLRN